MSKMTLVISCVACIFIGAFIHFAVNKKYQFKCSTVKALKLCFPLYVISGLAPWFLNRKSPIELVFFIGSFLSLGYFGWASLLLVRTFLKEDKESESEADEITLVEKP